MPRALDPAVRSRLLSAAAQVLATDGPKALTTRRLATEVGTSTMAVYTHFGSMDELRRDLRRDGFEQLCSAIDASTCTDDPVADLAAAVLVYVTTGVREPAVYRALFVDAPPDQDDDAGAGVYERLTDLVVRCVDGGRFSAADPALTQMWAAQVWLAAHGTVHLAQAGLLPEKSLAVLIGDMVVRLAVGYGDRPECARDSIAAGTDRT